MRVLGFPNHWPNYQTFCYFTSDVKILLKILQLSEVSQGFACSGIKKPLDSSIMATHRFEDSSVLFMENGLKFVKQGRKFILY